MPDSRVTLSRRRSNRVLPSPDSLLEIRPNRRLYVTRLGPNQDQEPSAPVSCSPPVLNEDNGLVSDVGVSPDGQTALFFIHGVGGSSRVWRAQYQYFANIGFDVIVPDLIGHGLSDKPQRKSSYHFTEIALDLLALFDRFHLRRNVMIGHSYGSSFATLIAKERETSVTKLVLISGGGPTALWPQAGVFQLPVCLLDCFKPLLVKRLTRKAFFKARDQQLIDDAFQLPTDVLRYMMQGQDWLEGDEEFHESLLVPTLLIYGRNDVLVSVDEELAMKEAIDGSKLVVIEEASHMVTLEKPEQVNRYIQQFLALKQWRFTPRSERTNENKRPSPFNVIKR